MVVLNYWFKQTDLEKSSIASKVEALPWFSSSLSRAHNLHLSSLDLKAAPILWQGAIGDCF